MFFIPKWRIISITLLGIISIAICSACVIDKLHKINGYHYRDQVAVLEYHHLAPQASEYTITPETFIQQLEKLQAHNYAIISMKQFLDFKRGDSVPPNAILLTFDDGYKSFYTYAYPILKKLGLTATNFLIVSNIEQKSNSHFLNKDETMEMNREGFSFYSHTYRMHDFIISSAKKIANPLTDLIPVEHMDRLETKEEYERRIEQDLGRSDMILQGLFGPQDKILCLPHGMFKPELLHITDRLGIQYVFTGLDGLNQRNQVIVRRIDAGSSYITPDKLLKKLNEEGTLKGYFKSKIKNWIKQLQFHRLESLSWIKNEIVGILSPFLLQGEYPYVFQSGPSIRSSYDEG